MRLAQLPEPIGVGGFHRHEIAERGIRVGWFSRGSSLDDPFKDTPQRRFAPADERRIERLDRMFQKRLRQRADIGDQPAREIVRPLRHHPLEPDFGEIARDHLRGAGPGLAGFDPCHPDVRHRRHLQRERPVVRRHQKLAGLPSPQPIRTTQEPGPPLQIPGIEGHLRIVQDHEFEGAAPGPPDRPLPDGEDERPQDPPHPGHVRQQRRIDPPIQAVSEPGLEGQRLPAPILGDPGLFVGQRFGIVDPSVYLLHRVRDAVDGPAGRQVDQVAKPAERLQRLGYLFP